MLKVQFNHKVVTKHYADLRVGDIFMILDGGDIDGRVFMYTDNRSGYYPYNNCVNLTEGIMYDFAADTSVVILQNTQLIVED